MVEEELEEDKKERQKAEAEKEERKAQQRDAQEKKREKVDEKRGIFSVIMLGKKEAGEKRR